MICPSTLVASITAAAIAIAEGKTADELSVLGAVFTQLGDTLATIAAQRGAIENNHALCEKEQKK